MENSDITVENTESEPSSEEVTASTSEAGEKGEEGGATSSEEVSSQLNYDVSVLNCRWMDVLTFKPPSKTLIVIISQLGC